MSKIVVIDDEPAICWGLKELAESMGHDVETFSSVEKSLQSATARADIAIVDVRLPGMTGLDGISHLREKWNGLPVIVITAYGNLSTAVSAIKNGAFEYVLKPFDLDQVQKTIERALAYAETESASETLPSGSSIQGDASETVTSESLMGSSPAMQNVFKQIALAANSDAAILLAGESGTGKELVARAIHKNSDRCDKPFVAVNLAALSPSLAESELFGHTRGAFTGADIPRQGLLSQADGGTLFLDEVADIPLNLQIKLLRALELKEFNAVGSTEITKSNFRIISASHRELKRLVQTGDFRHDLFYRLSAFEIEIPPLRERGDDIEELASHFLRQAAKSEKHSKLSPEAIRELKNRRWPGNVRELRNAIEHGAIVARGQQIHREHLPQAENNSLDSNEAPVINENLAMLIKHWTQLQYQDDSEKSNLHEALVEEIERPLFQEVLSKCNGNFSLAARQLGIHRTTLKKKVEAYGI